MSSTPEIDEVGISWYDSTFCEFAENVVQVFGNLPTIAYVAPPARLSFMVQCDRRISGALNGGSSYTRLLPRKKQRRRRKLTFFARPKNCASAKKNTPHSKNTTFLTRTPCQLCSTLQRSETAHMRPQPQAPPLREVSRPPLHPVPCTRLSSTTGPPRR